MRNSNFLYWILAAMLFVTSCQDDDQELGRMLDKSEIDFEVIQDLNADPGGNTVILKNNTPGTVSIWDYGTGRSNRAQDTVRFAFKGDYAIKFSVMTAGGIVELDPVTVKVTADKLDYVSGELWTLLTGGIGKEKTWILDNGKYGLAPTPVSYADPARNQVWGDYAPNYEPAPTEAYGNYEAAEMTFKLVGGPFITTVKPNEETGNESGTFFLNVNTRTLSTTNATIIRPANFIPNASNWTDNLNILELTENQLRIAVFRTNSEGPWWYILNYVSKEYADNYVPEAVPDPNFDFGDQMQILAGNSATTWRMETESPFNWSDLNGSLLNAWNTVADYPAESEYDAGAVANIDNVRLTFYRTGDVVLINDDGSEQRGSFSLDAVKNLVTFEGFKPSIYIAGDVTATTTNYYEDGDGNVVTGENQWKIVKTRTISGVTTEVWFGKRATNESKYEVYHFILESGIPDVKNEIIRGLCGKATGTSSRTFKIDTNWPVDWTNLEGQGWTVAGTQDSWYWDANIAASVEDQTLTFSQTDGVVTVTKKDENGSISTSPVEINAEERTIIIPDINIIQFGAGSWLPTAGPTYKWVRGEFNQVETHGMWIGVLSKDDEFTAYHYILK